MILPNGFSWSNTRKPKAPLPGHLEQHPQPEQHAQRDHHAQQREPQLQSPQAPQWTEASEPAPPPSTSGSMKATSASAPTSARFTFDQLGEQGEQMAQHVQVISNRFEDLIGLRDEFGAFIQTFEELMGAHRQARTKLAEQGALLAQHLSTSTSLRRDLTDAEARAAASDAELLGLRHEMSLLQRQAHANAESINNLKLEASENASRATSLERQLLFEIDKCTALQDVNLAKDTELANVDRQSAEHQKQAIELRSALTASVSEVGRLQALVDEIQPELQRAKQRQSDLETALHKAELANRNADEKIAQVVKERETIQDRLDRDKYEFETTIAALHLQMDGLSSRHDITLKHLDHARASYAECFESSKQWERSCKQAQAGLTAAERRLQLSEEQLNALETQRTDLEKSLADLIARNDMLSKAIAAKDAQISHLQSKASSFEHRYGSLLQSHENEHLQHEAAKRRLLEMLESEKAERALAQGALTIARANREKMSVQIESLKRGRPAGIVFDLPEDGVEGPGSVRMIASNEIPDCVKE